jgi:beta-N-acetylhexosaminidase
VRHGASDPTGALVARGHDTIAGRDDTVRYLTDADADPDATHTVPQTEDACVAGTLAGLSLKQQAGQLIMIGTPVDNPTSVSPAVRAYNLGGVFRAGRSKRSAAALRQDIASLQGADATHGIHLQIALDQEGGTVQTLQGTDFPAIPTAVAQGQLSASTLGSQTVAWASRLAAIGVTIDLAPVADTVPSSIGTKNPPIGALYREYGSDPSQVAADISVVVSAVQSTGVLTTLKHFPGLGRVLVNTDFSTGAVDNVATMHDPYLAPFASGIHAGTGVVMVSSATYPKIDANSVAAFSAPIVTGLLRQQLGFTGLVISDDLGNAKAVSAVPVGQRAVRFVQAGGDVVLTVNASDAAPMVSALIAAAQSSTTFAAQVKAAVTQVLRTKYRTGLLPCSPTKP